MNIPVAARATAPAVHNYWTMSRGDSDRAFRAARKHSRTVRRLRVAMPLGLGAMVVVFMLWTWLNPMLLLSGLPIGGGDLMISGTKLTMEKPRLAGFTRDARPYKV